MITKPNCTYQETEARVKTTMLRALEECRAYFGTYHPNVTAFAYRAKEHPAYHWATDRLDVVVVGMVPGRGTVVQYWGIYGYWTGQMIGSDNLANVKPGDGK